MLNGSEFLTLFDLAIGQVHTGYEIVNIYVSGRRTGEVNVSSYYVEIQLTWVGMEEPATSSPQRLRSELSDWTEGVRTVTTNHPYKCELEVSLVNTTNNH